MGKRLIIPGITSFTGPKIYADPIMSKGSLLLWDPTHPDGGDLTGLSEGTVLGNVAADVAAGILGMSAAAARPVLYNSNPAGSIPSLRERTAKGGIYGLWSHGATGNTVSGGMGLRVEFLRNYMFDNSDHAFFVSTWFRSLRRGIQGVQNAAMPLGMFARASSPSGSSLWMLAGGNAGNVLGQRNLGFGTYDARLNNVEPRIINQARQTWNGNNTEKPANVGLTAPPYFSVGGVSGYSGANTPGVSGIIEHAYIEDLTVSGRSYAEVDAIDFALFTAAHAEGGAWFGDTYPDPATFP